eukprot:9545642-Alexandrium_andersonii.AAC.1
MSASLVGSEMCIRDRPLMGRTHLAGRQTLWSEPAASAREQQHPRAVLSPVSYTHLTLPTICSV